MMKQRLTPLIMSLCLLGIVATPVFASSSTEKNQTQKISMLESEVAELRKEMAEFKSQKKTTASSNKNSTSTTKKSSKPRAQVQQSTTQSSSYNSNSVAAGNSQIEGPTDLPTVGPLYLPVDLDVPGQSFVSSGPYMGIPFEFTGGHLIVNSPNVNEDIILLQVDKNVDQRLAAMGRPAEKALGSHILLSGLIEAQALVRNGGGSHSSSDIDLTSANLDVYIMGPSTWTSAFVEFAYDNNIGTQTGSFSSNDRMLNSHVFVNKAFIVLGDFTKSPFYSSFGQMFVPFGTYSTTMVSSPLTKILGRTLARPLVVGFKQQSENSLLASAYIFRGPSHLSDDNHVNNGGINLSYTFKQGHTIGAGVIANIADSVGMQFTGNNNNNPPLFGGFGGPIETFTPVGGGPVEQIDTGSEQLEHRVPAYDFNAKVALGENLQLIGEYILASTSFSPGDLQINDEGAKPQALNLEAVYNMPFFVNPTSISFSYQMSKDALAIGLPEQRYSVTINRSFWKNTLQSLEFRHDINYADDDTSSGSGVAGPTGNGRSANQVTLQFDYYF